MENLVDGEERLKEAEKVLLQLQTEHQEGSRLILELIEKIAKLDREIDVQKKIIAALQTYTNSDQGSETGHQDSGKKGNDIGNPIEIIRWILNASKKPMRAIDVRGEIERLGYTLTYASPIAAITNSLQRLQAAGEVFEVRTEDGKRAFVWNENAKVRVRRYRSVIKE